MSSTVLSFCRTPWTYTELHVDYISIKMKRKQRKKKKRKWAAREMGKKSRSQVKTLIFQTVDTVSFKIKYTNTHVGIYSFNKQKGPNQT